MTAYQTEDTPVRFKPDVSMHFHFIVTGNKKRGLTDKKHANNKNEAGSPIVHPILMHSIQQCLSLILNI